MVKTFIGMPPEGAELVGKIESAAYGSEVPLHDRHLTWDVYLVQTDNRSWHTVKVCAAGRAHNKANYLLTWSSNQMRFSGGPEYGRDLGEHIRYMEIDGPLDKSELGKLWQHRPWLYRAVMGVMVGHTNAGYKTPPFMRLTVTDPNAAWAYAGNGAPIRGSMDVLVELIAQAGKHPLDYAEILEYVNVVKKDTQISLDCMSMFLEEGDKVSTFLERLPAEACTPEMLYVRNIIAGTHLRRILTGEKHVEVSSSIPTPKEESPKTTKTEVVPISVPPKTDDVSEFFD